MHSQSTHVRTYRYYCACHKFLKLCAAVSAFPSPQDSSRAMPTVHRGEVSASTLSRGAGGPVRRFRPAFAWLSERSSARSAPTAAAPATARVDARPQQQSRRLVFSDGATPSLPFGAAFVPPWRPPRSASVVRPVVHIEYQQRRRPAVVASRVGSSSTAVAVVAPAVARQPFDAGQMRAAAAAVVAAAPMFDRRAVVDATDRGDVLRSALMQERKLHFQMSRLITLLPLASVARYCNRTVDELSGIGCSRVAQQVIQRPKKPWKWSTVRDWHNTFARFLVWLARRDVVHDGQSFDTVACGEFLAGVDSGAKAKAPGNMQRAAERDAKAAAAARARGEPPPPPSRWQSGEHAAAAAKQHLRRLAVHFFLDIPVDRAGSFGPSTGAGEMATRRPRAPTPALPPEAFFRLCEYVVRRDACQYHLSVVLGLLFCVLSCNRAEQANSCFITRVSDGIAHGVLVCDKHPNPDRKQSRPFWVVLDAPACGDRWFTALCTLLRGVESGCFVFRDFSGDSGDPMEAQRFLNAPLMDERLVRAIACVLVRVCGMSWAEAALFAKHAARHVLPEVAARRRVHPLRQVEIGRWSGSTAQDADLTPAAGLARRHCLQAAVMPAARRAPRRRASSRSFGTRSLPSASSTASSASMTCTTL